MIEVKGFEFIFLRHGESVGNSEGFYQGQHDFPLTEAGEQQVQILAERWLAKEVSFDKIISSPLLRAKQTAEIIQEALNIPLETDPIWMERHNGMLAGVKRDEAEEFFPGKEFMSLYDPIGGTGESEWILFLRGAQAVQSLLRRDFGRYLIVSHGGLLNRVMHAILGIKLEPNLQGIRFGFWNTAFVEAHYTPDEHHWHIVTINDQAHLSTKTEGDAEYTITLLRHGESVGNVEGRFQGQAEYPLSENGKEQAQVLADRWEVEGVKFDHVLASPQSRAWETAEIIIKKLGLAIEKHDALKELNNGKMAGMKDEEIKEQFLERPEFGSPYIQFGENGESFWDFYLRTGRFLQSILERPPGHYLIVAHGGTNSLLLANMLGIHPVPLGSMPSFRFGNTGFARLTYQPKDNRWRVLRIGDNIHLDPTIGSTP